MTEDRAAQIAQLEALIAELEGQMAEPMPPRPRQEQEQGLAFAQRARDALRANDREAFAENVAGIGARVPKALRGVAAYTAASAHVQIVRTVEPWQVWVRWDAVPPELREEVVSLASLWRDTIAGRALGRPPKKR